MAFIEFFIPGRPIPQERPFVTRRGAFDRPRSKARKAEIAIYARKAAVEQKWKMTDKPFGIHMLFNGARSNADLDNLSKLVMDSLSGILWKDDRQVMRIWAEKTAGPGEEPSTLVLIWNYPEDKEEK